MKKSLRLLRRAITVIFFQAFIISNLFAAPVIRVSTENSENHPQTLAIKDFVNLANDRLNGQLELTLFSSGKLFRGSDVVNAVSAGRMEIAVPGIWHLSKFIPDLNLFLLPRFYGVSAEENHKIRDGEIGNKLLKKIERTLNAKVLGRWIDLGHAHIFTSNKKITRPADLQGMLIRVAGGKGNIARIEAMGAKAISIPWPDFPSNLERGEVDGTLTTAATINSVKLWEKGIKYAYLDRQYFPQYIPIISNSVWRRLSDQEQAALTSSWNDIVDLSRERAAAFQEKAIENLKTHGVEVFTPTDADIKETRKSLLQHEPDLIKNLHISIEIPDEATTKTE